VTKPSKRDLHDRIDELEGDDEELNQLSVAMMLSEPDRYDLVDEERRIYRDTKTGRLGRAPWVDELEEAT
jgi:hypothetical protein